MQNSLPLWAVIVVAVVPLLISQAIAAFTTLKTKRMEVFYARKADAYTELIMRIGVFARDPRNRNEYEEFLRTYNVALMLASEGVVGALAGREGLSVAAQRLRVAEGENELLALQMRDWYDATERVITAMRSDLQRL